MIRKILFQLHWIIGITFGTALAFSGLTGALLAFGPELTDFFSGANDKVAVSGPTLSPAQLYEKIHAAVPGRTISKLYLYDEPGKPALVTFAALPGSERGPTGPVSEAQRVNPYTGELLPVKRVGRAVRRFELWLREVHQGHWFGPGTASAIAAWCIGWGSVLLFFMVLGGLYLRWPRGKAARRLASWLRIYPRLKGRAFLFNLHAVFGTCALLGLLVLAHSGAFQSAQMKWYTKVVRALTGAPQEVERRGPPGGGGAMGAMAGPPGGGGPPSGGPPGGVQVYYMNAASFVNADTIETNVRVMSLDTTSGELRPQPQEQPQSFGEKVVANNQNIHEGRIWGWPATLVLMLSALCLPGFWITGWMMYLQRRGRGTARVLAG